MILWTIRFGRLEKESKTVLSEISVGGFLVGFFGGFFSCWVPTVPSRGKAHVFYYTFMLCISMQGYCRRFSSVVNRRRQKIDSSGDFSKMASWELIFHQM